MPNSPQHKEKAERNIQFAAIAAATPGHPEWVAVALFYAAVHLAERLRTLCKHTKDQHSKNHDERLSFLAGNHPTDVYVAFKALYDASLLARYGTCPQFAKAYPGDIVQQKLQGECYKKIAEYVAQKFAPPAAPASPPSGGS